MKKSYRELTRTMVNPTFAIPNVFQSRFDDQDSKV
jgi:hypothetical protein